LTQEVPELDSDILETFSNSRVEQSIDLSSPNLWVVYSLESITVRAKSKKAVCEKPVGSSHGDVPSYFVSFFVHMLDQNKKGHRIFWKGAKNLQIELNTTCREYKELAHMFLVVHMIRESDSAVQLNCMGMFHFYIVLYRCVCLLFIT
jgi:hypothetical protein